MLAKKADDSIRLCVDYCRFNVCTVKDALPHIDDTLDQLGKEKYFSTFDLQSGYWQVPVHNESHNRTAFATPDGLFQFKHTGMPFGLTNAPATFQRLMNTMLRGLNFKTGLIYPDGEIVFSTTFAEHIARLRLVLEALQRLA